MTWRNAIDGGLGRRDAWVPSWCAHRPCCSSPVRVPCRLRAATLAPQGVVKWRFQVSGQYVLHPPVVGPDGGVVVASSSGDVYSLTADGVLRWVVRSVGADGGPSIGPNGTVYVASMNTITAIAPNGSIQWTFTEPSSGQGVIAGPTVGPDGNVYAISDYRRPRRVRAVAGRPASLEQPGHPDLLGARPARRQDRVQLRAHVRGVRRGQHRPEHDVRPVAARLSAVGETARGQRRPVHAAAAPTGDRRERLPLPHRDGRRERLESVPRRPGERERPLAAITGTVERDVSSERRTGWVGLSLQEPQLPGLSDAGRTAALDILRRLDHRSARRWPRRERGRRREPAELR